MTVNEAVARAARAVGECISREELCEWLAEIENTVILEICALHDGDYRRELMTGDDDGDRLLNAPEPYSRIYLNYLIMKSDLTLRDIPQYINSASVFAESFRDFADWYNRTYMPLSVAKILIGG